MSRFSHEISDAYSPPTSALLLTVSHHLFKIIEARCLYAIFLRLVFIRPIVHHYMHSFGCSTVIRKG